MEVVLAAVLPPPLSAGRRFVLWRKRGFGCRSPWVPSLGAESEEEEGWGGHRP